MIPQEARKVYTNLLKFCGIGYYNKLEAGKKVDPIPEDLLKKLNKARQDWINSLNN